MIGQFLVNRKHCVAVEGGKVFLMDSTLDVPQGSFLGPLMLIRYTADMF